VVALPAETLAVIEALESNTKAKTQVAVAVKAKNPEQSGSMARSFVIGSTTELMTESTISKFRKRQQKHVVAVSKLLPKRKAGKRKRVDEKTMDAYVKSFFMKPLSACSTMEYAWAKSMCEM
jgi:hypothetical protein